MTDQIFVFPEMGPLLALDAEIARINALLNVLHPQGWEGPTRCEGWTVRDVVSHLDGVEEYNEACLNDVPEKVWQNAMDRDELNDRQIRARVDLSHEGLLQQWHARQTRVRQAWERLDPDTRVQTAFGDQPLEMQIWYTASEYATHADDMGVEVPADQQAQRLEWRVRFSDFVIRRREGAPQVKRVGDRMIAAMNEHEVELTWMQFVEAVSGRLAPPQAAADRRVVEALRTLA
jgi:uncharacterized protein (TIGR03083 family)